MTVVNLLSLQTLVCNLIFQATKLLAISGIFILIILEFEIVLMNL